MYNSVTPTPRLRLLRLVTRLRLAPWQHGASNKRQNESAPSSGGDAFISPRRVSDREHFNASSSHSQKNPLSERCSTSQVSPRLCWLNKQVHEWCRIKGSDAALVLSVYIRVTCLRFRLVACTFWFWRRLSGLFQHFVWGRVWDGGRGGRGGEGRTRQKWEKKKKQEEVEVSMP